MVTKVKRREKVLRSKEGRRKNKHQLLLGVVGTCPKRNPCLARRNRIKEVGNSLTSYSRWRCRQKLSKKKQGQGSMR